MKAYLEDQHIDFSTIKQQDEFLHSLNINLLDVVEHERNLPQRAREYRRGTFLSTITKLVRQYSASKLSSNSTVSTHGSTISSRLSSGTSTRRPRQLKGIAKLRQLSTNPNQQPLSVNQIDVCINSVHFDPDDDSEDDAFQLLGKAVMQIRNNVRDPSFYQKHPCLICGHPGHSFAECPTMTANTPKTFEVFGKLVNLLDRGFRMTQGYRRHIGSTYNPLQPPQLSSPAAVPTQALSSAPAQDPVPAPIQAINSVGSHSASTLTNPTYFNQTPIAQPMSCMSTYTAPSDWTQIPDPISDTESIDTDNGQNFG